MAADTQIFFESRKHGGTQKHRAIASFNCEKPPWILWQKDHW